MSSYDLTWKDGHELSAVSREYKAFVAAREAFEKAAAAKCGAKAFSYKRGGVGVGCDESKPQATPQIDAKTLAALAALLRQQQAANGKAKRR